MTTFGVRYEGDVRGPWGPYVVDSVNIANDHLAKRGSRFYFSEVDVEQKIIGGSHCCDMFGWVVPDEDADRFERLWLSRDCDDIDEFDYVSVEWKDENGIPVPIFDMD